MAKRSRPRGAFLARELCHARDREWIARLQKCVHVIRETGLGERKARGGA